MPTLSRRHSRPAPPSARPVPPRLLLALVLPAFVLLAFAAACGRGERSSAPAPEGRLRLAFTTAPRPAGAAPINGTVDRIRLDRRSAAGDPLAPPVTVPIAPGQESFEASLEAPAGPGFSVVALALGEREIQLPGGPPATGSGILYYGRADSLVANAVDPEIVTIEFTPFVPELAPPEFGPEGPEHTVRWTPVTGAAFYRLSRLDPKGSASDTLLPGTSYRGRLTPTRYSVAAIEHSGTAGAPSDVVEASTPLPGAPSGLTALVLAEQAVRLAWRPGSGPVESYELERAEGEGFFAALATLPATSIAFTDQGVLDGRAYRWRVRARSAAGATNYSDEAGVTLPLNAPTGLVAAAAGSRILVRWTERSASETGVEVSRRLAPTGLFQSPIPLPAGTAEYSDGAVQPGFVYEYRARVVNALGVSEWSGVDTAIVRVQPPATPTGFAALGLSPSEIRLSWSPVAGADSIRVYRRQGIATFTPIRSLPGGAVQHVDAGLAEAAIYDYRLVAINIGGASPPSSPDTAATHLPAPGGLVATGGRTAISLAWNDQSLTETGFEIQRRNFPSGGFAPLVSVAANVEGFSDAQVAQGTAYGYRVRAVKNSLVSAWAAEDSALVLPAPPAPPANVDVDAVANGIGVFWTDSSTNEEGFRVERQVNAVGTPWVHLGDAPANATQFLDTTAACFTIYNYRVRAFNPGGSSAYTQSGQPYEVFCAE